MESVLETRQAFTLALAAGLLSACAGASSMERIDALARSTSARTILLEADISLYSPYDTGPTREYLLGLRQQRDEVFALFGVTDGPPILVWLRPNAGLSVDLSVEGDMVRLNGIDRRPQGDVYGRAAGELVVIEVDPPRILRLGDGREITSSPGVTMFTDTIRHELAHIAVNRAGVRTADWLGEGIAHAVEWIPIEEGRFMLDPVPRNSRAMRRPSSACCAGSNRFPPPRSMVRCAGSVCP